MICNRLANSLALAAFLAVPTLALSNTTSTAPLDKAAARQHAADPTRQAKADRSASSTGAQADVSAGTRTANGAYVAPLEKNAANQQAAADCDHPQAGKLADKSTGQAKEHSASPVHMDCATDAKPTLKKKKTTKTAAADSSK